MYTPTRRAASSRNRRPSDYINLSLPGQGKRRTEERRVTFRGDSPRSAASMRPVTVQCVERPPVNVPQSPRAQLHSPRLPHRSGSAYSGRSVSSAKSARARPRTVSAKIRSRPLGADIYPTLGNSDIDQEKAYFRAGTGFINYLFSTTPRTLSARWRAMAPEGDNPRGESFCRSSRAESHMNNATLARVYHVVPERVLSARAPLGGQSLLLQQLNQSLCDRRMLYTHRIASVPVPEEEKEVVEGKEQEDPSPGSAKQRRFLRTRYINPLEHSSEWVEETKIKQEESVAILSQQLKSMLEDSPEVPQVLSQQSGVGHDGDVPSSETRDTDRDRQTPLSKADSPTPSRSPSANDIVTTPSRASVTSQNASSKDGTSSTKGDYTSRMKMVQCEVLGPYSCSDCTKIRLSEKQQQEQRAMFPGLSVHPRTLVAPQMLSRINRTLPPALTSDKFRLDCGCAISLHRDFLFPVIVTDHDVHSRLCSVQRSRVKSPDVGRSTTSRDDLHSQGSLPTGMLDGGMGTEQEAGDDGVGVGVGEEEEVSMSPADMRVTVRYNTPSPQQKSVFVT